MEEKTIIATEEKTPSAEQLSHDADALWETGKKEFFDGDFSSALRDFEEAFRLYKQVGNTSKEFEVLNHIGYLYLRTGEFKKSHEQYDRALQLSRETGDPKDIGTAYGNLGMIYDEEGKYPLALEYYHKALKIYEERGYQKGIAHVHNNIGIVYFFQDNFSLALDYFQKALVFYETTEEKHIISRILGNIGYIQTSLGNHEAALQLHERERKIKEELGDQLGLALTYNYLGSAYKEKGNIPLAIEYFQKALAISREKNDNERMIHSLITLSDAFLEKNDVEQALKFAAEALERSQSSANKRFEKESVELLYKISKIQSNTAEALEYLERFIKLKDELQGAETARKIESLKASYDLELSEKERQLTEKVLFNVLPPAIATRIRNGEENIIEQFHSASILFADIVGFTSWSSKRNVDEVAKMLDHLFKMFDELATALGIEKIKTIGDAYMCVAGLPEVCDDHAERICNMALAMNRKVKELFPAGEIRLRIGIHTGEVIAGILGKNKYAYDLWGDAVNTASRMESHSLPEKIQVTQDVVDAVNDKFQFEARGEVEVKGKGRMKTWFLKDS